MEYVPFDPAGRPWKEIMAEQLATARRFEIHCWSDEPQWIALALRYGQWKEIGWPYGTVIAGEVTPAFTHMLLSLPTPADREVYDKQTPFFSIFLDNGFSSEHYGTELHQGI